MTHHVNLMTEGALFRTAARAHTRRWALAVATAGTLLTPIAIWQWQDGRRVRQEHEALEAAYEPIRRLITTNMQIRTQAANLVHDERLALELSRSRPISTLLAIAGEAAKSTGGALFIEHMQIQQTPPGAQGAPPGPDRLVIEVACTLKYDVSNFVAALKVPPIVHVKVVSDELVAVSGVDRKNYTVECLLNAPMSAEATHAN